MADQQTLEYLRKTIQGYLGLSITFRSRDRKQSQIRTGVVDGVYASVFTVMLDDRSGSRRVSFTYCDLLTENITLLPIA